MDDSHIPDETLTDMVHHLRPAWRVRGLERVEEGVNSTAVVEADTLKGRRRVVLKPSTSDHPLTDARARAEPQLLSRFDRESDVPVPAVLGSCAEREGVPTPYFLMEYVEGVTHDHARAPELPRSVRETVFREAGRNLAALQDLGPLSTVGDLVGRDGGVSVLDTPDSPSYDAFHDWLLDAYEEALDLLENGGYFPELTEDPTRFADLVPELRAYLRATVPDLPPPAPPTYCHKDYRYGNLVVEPDTGETRAVLDWANLMSAPPAFNLAIAESKLLKPDLNGDADAAAGRAGEFRRALWDGYAARRDGWTFDGATRERIRLYRLAFRLDQMACLPLFADIDPTLDDRDARAAEHRAFVEQYI